MLGICGFCCSHFIFHSQPRYGCLSMMSLLFLFLTLVSIRSLIRSHIIVIHLLLISLRTTRQRRSRYGHSIPTLKCKWNVYLDDQHKQPQVFWAFHTAVVNDESEHYSIFKDDTKHSLLQVSTIFVLLWFICFKVVVEGSIHSKRLVGKLFPYFSFHY